MEQKKNTHILLIDCQDSPALIHRITGVISDFNCNIISNGEYVDQSTGHFYMRSEFTGTIDNDMALRTLNTVLPEGSNVKLLKKRRKRIVVLATREHHCLGDILLRNHFDELDAEILTVISNHDVLRPLTSKFDLPYVYLPSESLSREEHENRVLEVIAPYKPDYIILAKYMRILTPRFVSAYPGSIINIHHSFLPAFIGASPYKQAFERGVKIIGATGHFVSNDLDEGPIIAQSVIEIDHSHSLDTMIHKGREIERTVLARSMKLAFEDRIIVRDNKTVIFD